MPPFSLLLLLHLQSHPHSLSQNSIKTPLQISKNPQKSPQNFPITMRIRRSATSSVSPPHTFLHHHQSPSCSSSSSCFSSSHSTISTHSLTSSSNSTSSSSFPSLPLSPSRRCEGLDLLVKAIYFVSGSVVGVPYIQKRVIRRRKPALKFTNLVINSVHKLGVNLDDENDNDDDDEVLDCCSNLLEQNQKLMMKTKKKKTTVGKQKNRSKAVPVKYQDSVLQSWKSSYRRRRRSSKV